MAHLRHLVLALVLVPLFTFYECSANPEDTKSIQLNDDVLGLIVFKSDLHDPQNTLSSWNEDDDSPCSWRFILCNPSTGRVSEISMEGLSLSGKLGRGIKELQFLKSLSLSNNNLTGNIGDVLTQLPASLEKLNLSHNSFSGQISSSMVKIDSIKILDLSENLLTGSVPESLFGGCSLHYLSLAGNSLEGSLPSTLAKCVALNGLNLANNRLSGNPFVSVGIWSLSRIRVLDLSNNKFSGHVPTGILALHYLKELHLQSNLFSGSIPSDIGFCPHLIQVDLSKNQFNGGIPGSFKLLTSLTLLDLSSNILTGEFPPWIGNLRSLQNLVLSKNNISGMIPESLASCSELSIVQIRENALSGIIPEILFSMGLQQLDLSWNNFTGSIPPGSSRLFNTLLAMDLSGNKLTGNIPPEMGLFTNLGYLNLSYNTLHSRIPPELGYLQKLQVLDLRNNAFYESIPGDLCESGSLTILQLDQNYLTGPIPTAIANCSSLYLLSLSYNNLSGMIPRTMVMLKKLEILKLEFNQLTGEIPPELSTLQSLLAVNVSYNRLVGRLPQGGIFPSLDRTSLEGNLGICSPLLKGPCMMNIPKPLVLDPNQVHGHSGGGGDEYEAPATSNHHKFLSLSVIVAMAAALMIIAGVVVITLLNASTRRRLEIVKHKSTESMFSSSPKSFGGSPSMGRLILFDSRSSTNPESLFTMATQIGESGTVYRAIIEEVAGREVAIKRLPQTNLLQHPQDFDREVRLLGRVRNPNLVSLRGYYWTPQLQLLVSDYISNAVTLQSIHGLHVSWATRFKIMLGTAKALAHLHHSCKPPIIHYNLKPSNILLDQNFNVKVSDFGLYKLLAKSDNRFQTALGYVAPEMTCQSLRVNEKCDVYGYGVMILELVTGRRPMEYGEDNIVILNDHVRVMLEQGNMLGCIDDSMGDYPEEEVLPVLKLALVCTSQIPSNRPSMAEVVQILQVIKTPVPPRTDLY